VPPTPEGAHGVRGRLGGGKQPRNASDIFRLARMHGCGGDRREAQEELPPVTAPPRIRAAASPAAGLEQPALSDPDDGARSGGKGEELASGLDENSEAVPGGVDVWSPPTGASSGSAFGLEEMEQSDDMGAQQSDTAAALEPSGSPLGHSGSSDQGEDDGIMAFLRAQGAAGGRQGAKSEAAGSGRLGARGAGAPAAGDGSFERSLELDRREPSHGSAEHADASESLQPPSVTEQPASSRAGSPVRVVEESGGGGGGGGVLTRRAGGMEEEGEEEAEPARYSDASSCGPLGRSVGASEYGDGRTVRDVGKTALDFDKTLQHIRDLYGHEGQFVSSVPGAWLTHAFPFVPFIVHAVTESNRVSVVVAVCGEYR